MQSVLAGNTVTNYSNASVRVNLNFKADVRPFQDVTGTFTNAEYVLESAEGKGVEEADSMTSELTLAGSLDEGYSNKLFGNANLQLSTVA